MKTGDAKLLIRNLRKMKEQEKQKQALDLSNVRLSLPNLEREFIRYGEYLNQCINERGVMTYPEIQAATKVWMETRKRFSIGNEA